MDALRIAERAKTSAIVFKAIRPQILRNRSNLARLMESIEPIKGSEWPRALIEIAGPKPINDILDCIKSSIPPLEEINTIRKIPKGLFGTQKSPLIVVGNLARGGREIPSIRNITFL